MSKTLRAGNNHMVVGDTPVKPINRVTSNITINIGQSNSKEKKRSCIFVVDKIITFLLKKVYLIK